MEDHAKIGEIQAEILDDGEAGNVLRESIDNSVDKSPVEESLASCNDDVESIQ